MQNQLQQPTGGMIYTSPGAAFEEVSCTFPTTYAWEYGTLKESLRNLYEKAKAGQWDAQTRVDWSIDVDPEAENMPDAQIPIFGTDIWNKMNEKERRKLRHEFQGWMLSQFLHGEQGALLATAQIVDAVPLADAKFYASTQVMDEARHVEVYDKYLRDKIELQYPINPHLKSLLDQIMTDSRWDMKYIGMQIMVEGLALAAFQFIHKMSKDPLIRDITHYVMLDEARHVAFGVLTLQDTYAKGNLSPKEMSERQDFCYESSILMRDRFQAREVWERLGLPVDRCCEIALHSPMMVEFRKMLFSKIVPNLKRVGLLTGKLRSQFATPDLDILKFEDWESVDESNVEAIAD